MANQIMGKWKEALLNASANADLNGSGTTGVYAAMIDTGAYTFSSSHEFYSDFAAGVIGTPVELASGKTFTNGLFDAGDITFPAFAGTTVEAIALYRKNAGANTTWRFIAWIDTATGLTFTPSGSDLIIQWNASGILQL